METTTEFLGDEVENYQLIQKCISPALSNYRKVALNDKGHRTARDPENGKPFH
jgi:hypothetical protein